MFLFYIFYPKLITKPALKSSNNSCQHKFVSLSQVNEYSKPCICPQRDVCEYQVLRTYGIWRRFKVNGNTAVRTILIF
ncbi:hypothetical protein RRG08_028132 [Elysia crispata]|uniref:Uncharacterized protein n=1 Tax=Elysia crispata TaxID=231223 RepID=A0AAE0YY28_9GAST|nr:hypothetical protein RRG08_028132 [Elysia crispata]